MNRSEEKKMSLRRSMIAVIKLSERKVFNGDDDWNKLYWENLKNGKKKPGEQNFLPFFKSILDSGISFVVCFTSMTHTYSETRL
jgi:hypothetical protein